MSIIELQCIIFERVGHLDECHHLLKEWCNNEDWASLLEAVSVHVLLEEQGTSDHEENMRKCRALWRFFLAFFSAVKQLGQKQISGRLKLFLGRNMKQLKLFTSRN